MRVLFFFFEFILLIPQTPIKPPFFFEDLIEYRVMQ